MCSVEVVTLESLGTRLYEALSTPARNKNECSQVEGLIKAASEELPEDMMTSQDELAGNLSDFDAEFETVNDRLRDWRECGLDQCPPLPPELAQKSDGKEFFCYVIAVLIGAINRYPIGLLRTHLRRLEHAYGYVSRTDNETSGDREPYGPAHGVDWDTWDGADWMPAASGRRVPDPRSLVEIRTDDLGAVMSLLEDLIKESFGLGGLVEDLNKLLSSALAGLAGPSVVNILASSPHLMMLAGLIVLVYFHRLQHHLDERRQFKHTDCIVERADRMSQRSGHVSLDDLVKTYTAHERQTTPKGEFALCQSQRQDAHANCPFRSVSLRSNGAYQCLLAEPSHLDGREGYRSKVRRAMMEAVAEGRYHRRIDKDATDYYRTW